MRAIKDNYQINKIYLRKYRESQQKLDILANRIKLIEQKLLKIKGPNLSSQPKSNFFDNNKIADLIDKKEVLEKRLSCQLKKSWEIRKAIGQAIDTIDNPEASQIIELFYIDLKNLDEIATELHISVSSARRLYNKGLRQMKQPKGN